MKNKKMSKAKTIGILSFATILIMSVGIKVNAENIKFDKKTEISPGKIFSIKFNQEIDRNTIPSNVYVVDKNGDKQKINAHLDYHDNTKVEVEPPIEKYRTNETYTLVVGTGVKTATGKNLKNQVTMDFTTNDGDKAYVYDPSTFTSNVPDNAFTSENSNVGLGFNVTDGKVYLSKNNGYNYSDREYRSSTTNVNFNKMCLNLMKSMVHSDTYLNCYYLNDWGSPTEVRLQCRKSVNISHGFEDLYFSFNLYDNHTEAFSEQCKQGYSVIGYMFLNNNKTLLNKGSNGEKYFKQALSVLFGDKADKVEDYALRVYNGEYPNDEYFDNIAVADGGESGFVIYLKN